jgi:cell pole-organizing protein PopZ
MEDILASIRRILSEDEAPSGPVPMAVQPPVEAEVLALEPSMLVGEPLRAVPHDPNPVAAGAAEPAIAQLGTMESDPPDVSPPEPPSALPVVPPVAQPADEPTNAGLVAPAAAAAAASSLGTLVRTLAERQSLAVYRGGPTLEDIVREEMRPMLKAWLDKYLPPLVERVVRTEIERVIGRATS